MANVIKSDLDILKEARSVLHSKNNLDASCISLASVAKLLNGDISNEIVDLVMSVEDTVKLNSVGSFGIKSVNCSFSASITPNYIIIVYQNGTISYFSNDDVYKTDYPDSILRVLSGRERAFFDKIYVKISDCPEWMREALYALRKCELDEQTPIEPQSHKF